MTKAVTYLPFEDAVARFAGHTPRGAGICRPGGAVSKCLSSEDIPSDGIINRWENIR
jgi:hypothetical protein